MIVNEFKLGNTSIRIDNSFMATNEDEREHRYELFNEIGCEIYASINV